MLERADVAVLLTQDRLRDRRFGAEVHSLAPRAAHAAPRRGRRHLVVGAVPRRRASCPRAALDRRAAEVTPDDDALVIFSSGTTERAEGHAALPPRARPCSSGSRRRSSGATKPPACGPSLPDVLDRRAQHGDGLDPRRRRLLGDAGDLRAGRRAARSSRASASPSRTRSPTRPARSRSTPTGRRPTCRRCGACSASRRSPATRPCRATRPGTCPSATGCRRPARSSSATGRTPPRERLKHSMGRLLPGNQLRVVDPDTGARCSAPTRTASSPSRGPTLMRALPGPHRRGVLRRRRLLPHRRRRVRRRRTGYVHFTAGAPR